MDIKTTILEFIQKASGMLNFGQEGSVAIAIGIVILGILAIFAVVKFFKKILGTALTFLVVLAILVTTGALTITQLENATGMITEMFQTDIGNATESNGDAALNFIEENIK